MLLLYQLFLAFQAWIFRVVLPVLMVAASLALAAQITPSPTEPKTYTFTTSVFSNFPFLYENMTDVSLDNFLVNVKSQGLPVEDMGNYSNLLELGVHYLAASIRQYQTNGEVRVKLDKYSLATLVDRILFTSVISYDHFCQIGNVNKIQIGTEILEST